MVLHSPVNALESNTILVREVMLPMDKGMVPVNRLLSSSRFRTDVRPPMDEGSEPDHTKQMRTTGFHTAVSKTKYEIHLLVGSGAEPGSITLLTIRWTRVCFLGVYWH